MDVVVSNMESFGRVVRAARKQQVALGQVEAARLIGVSPPVINKLEQGKEVWLSKALEICNGLGIEVVLRLPDGDLAP